MLEAGSDKIAMGIREVLNLVSLSISCFGLRLFDPPSDEILKGERDTLDDPEGGDAADGVRKKLPRGRCL